MDRPLGAQISHMLRDRGVEVIFGIPGVHNQEMYRGIEEAGLTHVLARHEQGAGFMADGYARATGRPGVAYVITGPGVCNIMTPMGQAYSDSVPILVISSCLDETAATRGQLHQMKDQRAAAETVCDWSEEARTADAAYALIDRALSEFASMQPRPKHIQASIAALEGAAPSAPPSAATPAGPTFGRPGAQDGLAAMAANMLRRAEKPLIVFGGGAKAQPELARQLLDLTGAASFTTYAGRGTVSATDPLHLGSFLARPSSAQVIGTADVVAVIGSGLSETDMWRSELGHRGALIRIDLSAEALAYPRSDLAISGDAGAAMSAIIDHLSRQVSSADEAPARWDAREVANLRARWRAEVDAERPGIVPVADALRAAMPDDTMIYSDMTQFAYAAKEIWDMPHPGHWHHPTGFGTLGYALPAAIGGAMGRPGQPTMAIAGDYGFQYTIQDLATAVELGLPLPIILWDNSKLGEIEDSMVRAQIAPNAVIQRNPDFLKLADAYGARSAAPTSLDELPDVLAAAFAAATPTLIRLTPDIAG